MSYSHCSFCLGNGLSWTIQTGSQWHSVNTSVGTVKLENVKVLNVQAGLGCRSYAQLTGDVVPMTPIHLTKKSLRDCQFTTRDLMSWSVHSPVVDMRRIKSWFIPCYILYASSTECVTTVTNFSHSRKALFDEFVIVTAVRSSITKFVVLQICSTQWSHWH
jgi:hypothetical protein